MSDSADSAATDKIFQTAKARGEEANLPYAGALRPPEAHRLMSAGAAVVVDVRTAPELQFVGAIPEALAVEWQSYPTMAINPHFAEELQAAVPPEVPVLFICRSGVRSHHAAAVAAELGYRAYNILEGFEGDPDANKQRRASNGWLAHRLPWTQS